MLCRGLRNQVRRGVRQGDPLSPTLFLFAIETLGLALQLCKQIKGFDINEISYKVSMYADDTLVITDGSIESITNAMKILGLFGDLSGCKLNSNKSNAFYIGLKRECTDKPLNGRKLTWPVNNFTYLGVTIPIRNIKATLFNLNFDSSLANIQRIINMWSRRGLTLLGKVTIIKSLIIPTLLYKLSMVPALVPEQFVRKLNRMIFTFLWGSSWERVKRTVLVNDFENGGTNMIDVGS